MKRRVFGPGEPRVRVEDAVEAINEGVALSRAAHATMVTQMIAMPEVTRVIAATYGGRLSPWAGRTLTAAAKKKGGVQLLVGYGGGISRQYAEDVVVDAREMGATAAVLEDCHLKLWAVRLQLENEWLAVIGGRNLGGSSWSDASVMVTGRAAMLLAVHFCRLWSYTDAQPLKRRDVKQLWSASLDEVLGEELE